MTAISIVCAFVSIVCLVFNAIVVSKLGKIFSQAFDMKDQLDKLTTSFSPFSSLLGSEHKKIS